jgi:hypothetical protein
MSNRIHISRIPIKSQGSLGPDAKEALIEAKNKFRAGVVTRAFANSRGAYDGDGSPLPKLSAGCVYREVTVGAARQGDFSSGGRKRLVIEVHESSRRIKEVYYTEKHYLKFSFYRIV